MMPKRRKPNPKRRVLEALQDPDRIRLAELARRATYGGKSEHKRNPGDFGLTPLSGPRQGKTLCDGAEIFHRTGAHALLSMGLRLGLVSVQERNGWPQNVWAVAENGVALEAMLDNEETGSYHGYPLLMDDPLVEEIRNRWNVR